MYMAKIRLGEGDRSGQIQIAWGSSISLVSKAKNGVRVPSVIPCLAKTMHVADCRSGFSIVLPSPRRRDVYSFLHAMSKLLVLYTPHGHVKLFEKDSGTRYAKAHVKDISSNTADDRGALLWDICESIVIFTTVCQGDTVTTTVVSSSATVVLQLHQISILKLRHDEYETLRGV